MNCILWLGESNGYLTRGKLYEIAAEDKNFIDVINDHSEEGAICKDDFEFFKEVETFEQDGHTWIRHDGGDCPVPVDWVVIAKMKDGLWQPQDQFCASWYTEECWRNSISEFRIISTWDTEAPGGGSGISDDLNSHVTSVTMRGMPVEFVQSDSNTILFLDGPEYPNEEHREMVENAEESTEQDKIQQAIQTLRDLTQIQCSDGNWNYDEYMHGMANGMLFALSLFESGEPKYLDAPDAWLKDAVAAMEPKPEAPKTFPALRDIDYNPCLLGVGQFLNGGN